MSSRPDVGACHRITMTLDSQPVEDAIAGYRQSLSSLAPEVALQILDAFFEALDGGIVDIAIETDPQACVAGEQIIAARCRFVGADEFFAAALRAAQGGAPNFNGHGNPSGCELKGCGDLDSTAGADSRPDSREGV